MTVAIRSASFAQLYTPTWVDRLGVWLSSRQIRRWVTDFHGKRVGDFGCGYHASFARSLLPEVTELTLADVSISNELKADPKVRALEGDLIPSLQSLETGTLDVVLCISVLEHLWNPEEALCAFRRILRPGGVCLLNVPSWRGKFFLELSAFRLGLSPKEEMDDHKIYFDKRDFWPLLVKAGFKPSQIRCFSHKFGLNTFAACWA